MLILFLIVFIDLVGFGIIIPLLPFFGEHFSASPATVWLFDGVIFADPVYCSPFLGAPVGQNRTPSGIADNLGWGCRILCLAWVFK